jgi:hypothetical protein
VLPKSKVDLYAAILLGFFAQPRHGDDGQEHESQPPSKADSTGASLTGHHLKSDRGTGQD